LKRTGRRTGHAEAVQNARRELQAREQESEMPKLKTKSGAKKRFRFTANGKIKHGQTGKRHGMIKRSNEQIRNLRGTKVLSDSETQRIKRWMPYHAG
jgi:large subunit ribosomal protein L35